MSQASSPLVTGGFQLASDLHANQPDPFILPEALRDYLTVLSQLEWGTITLVETNAIKQIHQLLHHAMVKAVVEGWTVTLVDSANCFNPQLISTLAFNYGVHGSTILRNIGLSRPFQYHQSISIVKDLEHYLQDIPSHRSLVILTSLPSMFFDASVKQEDPLFPIPQLESYRQVAGILQRLAVQGHTMIVTDQSEIRQTVLQADPPPVIKPASMKYAAKIHVSIQESDTQRRVELFNHPYRPPLAHTEKIKPKPRLSRKPEITFYTQRSLDDFQSMPSAGEVRTRRSSLEGLDLGEYRFEKTLKATTLDAFF